MRRTLTALTAALTLAACAPAQPGTPTQPAPTKAEATQPPAPAPAPKTVLTARGDGMKSTKTFTVRDAWDIEYTYDCRDQYAHTGNFQVWDEEQGLARTYINDLGPRGENVAHQHLGGTLALKVNTLCRWTLKVIDV